MQPDLNQLDLVVRDMDATIGRSASKFPTQRSGGPRAAYTMSTSLHPAV
jgi:hypothetical protein